MGGDGSCASNTHSGDGSPDWKKLGRDCANGSRLNHQVRDTRPLRTHAVRSCSGFALPSSHDSFPHRQPATGLAWPGRSWPDSGRMRDPSLYFLNRVGHASPSVYSIKGKLIAAFNSSLQRHLRAVGGIISFEYGDIQHAKILSGRPFGSIFDFGHAGGVLLSSADSLLSSLTHAIAIRN